jgi:hypothetical protein
LSHLGFRKWHTAHTAIPYSDFPFWWSELAKQIMLLRSLDFFLWSFWSLRLMSTRPRLLMSWRVKLSAVSTKFNHVYAKRSWKISSKECICKYVCASKPRGPFTRYAIPYITLYHILYKSIKKSEFLIKNLRFFKYCR